MDRKDPAAIMGTVFTEKMPPSEHPGLGEERRGDIFRRENPSALCRHFRTRVGHVSLSAALQRSAVESLAICHEVPPSDWPPYFEVYQLNDLGVPEAVATRGEVEKLMRVYSLDTADGFWGTSVASGGNQVMGSVLAPTYGNFTDTVNALYDPDAVPESPKNPWTHQSNRLKSSGLLQTVPIFGG